MKKKFSLLPLGSLTYTKDAETFYRWWMEAEYEKEYINYGMT